MPPRKFEMLYRKKAALALALAAALTLCGCAQGLFGAGLPAPMPESQSARPIQSVAQGQSAPESAFAAAPESLPQEDYPYKAEMLALVNGVLDEYASGALPEPMRYNTNYSGIHSAAPPGTALPQAVALPDVHYEMHRGGTGPDTLIVRLALENAYTMDVQIDLDNSGTGKPARATGVSFYDMEGANVADFTAAPRGGDFLYLRSDRLYANADFENVQTEAGIVSGSISWSKANQFVWIDIDSMREPFFYTYFIVGEGELRQDYPQKEWQRLTVINDERMLTISQSLFSQFQQVLASAWPEAT